MTSFGRLKTTAKSTGLSVSPIPNITIISRVVIHDVFIHIRAVGTKSAAAATTTTIKAIYFPTKSLSFSRNFIIETLLFA